jgi:histidine triad (HIT) family protein
MLSEQEAENIKKQIIGQIESTFPEDKKTQAIGEIKSMNIGQLEEFLEKNNLVKSQNPGQNKCIFCSISNGETDSVKLDENSDAVAVLEINPISKAHTLVIPKKHIPDSSQLTEKSKELARKTAEKIKENFIPKEILISNANLFGHEIINVLPVYESETLDSERKPSKKEDLESIRESLKEKPKPKKVREPKTEKLKEKVWLPKRIP